MPSAWRVADALQQARAAGVARLDALLLLGHVLNSDRSTLTAHPEQALSADEATAWQGLLQQRADGRPLAYLLGRHEFHGLMLTITPAVLDPRPDTETLVDWALNLMPKDPGMGPAPRVLDLGTGSGAIALALKAARPHWSVQATDRSAEALVVARGNARQLGLDVDFHEGSWWRAAPPGRFDLIVSNPPYLASDDPHLPALRHEPRMALVAGADGLDDLRVLVQGAADRLVPGAWLLLEHGFEQAQAVAGLMAAAGLVDIAHRQDLAGHARCTGGRLVR